MPSVSVIIAARNAESTIFDSLSSILASAYSDLEIVFVDDASTDKTLEIAEALSSRDRRIKIYKNLRQEWLAASLNRAIELSSGEFLARLDADDMMTADRIARQIDVLKALPEIGIVGTAVAKIDEFGNYLGLAPPKCPSEVTFWTSIWRVPFFHPTVMVRRSIISENNLLYDEGLRRSQDYEIWRRALTHTRGYNIYRPLTLYRCHPKQTTLAHKHGASELHAKLCADHVSDVFGIEISKCYALSQLKILGVDNGAMSFEEFKEHIEFRESLAVTFDGVAVGNFEGSLGFGYDLLRYCIARRGNVNWRWIARSRYRMSSIARAFPLMKNEAVFRLKGSLQAQRLGTGDLHVD